MSSPIPEFLPPILDLSGSWGQILHLLYSVFEADFKFNRAMHEGIRVIYDGRVLPDGDGKEEGFWHVVSRLDKKTGTRLIEYRRAERLPWARPLMESPPRSEIKVFDYDHISKDKGVRRYIWLEDYDYLIVLQQKKRTYYWITAFYVESDGYREDLERRFKNRI